MTDVPPGGATAQTYTGPAHRSFPIERLLYALGFAFVAWFVLWVVFVLALAQFVVLVINGKANEEVRRMSLSLLQYLFELLAFVVFARDERPFPFAPFPNSNGHV
jgi:Domain of unknown function (DUF4389)